VREATGKCEGRKSYAERSPDLVQAAKRLHRRSPRGHRRSLREIASELAIMGYTQEWRAVLGLVRQVDGGGELRREDAARHCRGAERAWAAYSTRWTLAGDDSLECALARLIGRWNSNWCPTLVLRTIAGATYDFSRPHRPSASVYPSSRLMGHRRFGCHRAYHSGNRI
jgi:hypothetical protein